MAEGAKGFTKRRTREKEIKESGRSSLSLPLHSKIKKGNTGMELSTNPVFPLCSNEIIV